MASFASIVLLAAALLMAGRLSHAGPSTAEEVFWRAALPGSAMPDAVLQLLRPAMPERPAVPASGVSGGGDDPFGKYSFSSYDAPSERSGGEAATPTPTPTAEVFWRAVLPGSAVPDAVLRLLRPATASQGVPASGGAGKDPFGYDFKNYKAAPSERSHFRATTRGGGATATATATAPTTAVFFHEEAVRVGERLPLHFRAAAPAALGLLPRGVADSIPFTTAALPAVLALLGVPPGSSMAAAMAETLRTCERRPPAGDTEGRFCATSLEALVERAVAALGTRDVRAVTSALPRAGLPPQVYAVRAVRRLGGGAGASFVACHDEAYPYTVYMCHGTGPARAYLVEMEGARGGGAVTVATVCHTDTSRWNPEHVSFKVLGTKPGGKPVCHLMPYGHIIWAKNGTPSPA